MTVMMMMMMMVVVVVTHKSVLTRHNKRLSVKLTPSSECRKSLLKALTRIFRLKSNGNTTVKAPSTTAAYTNIKQLQTYETQITPCPSLYKYTEYFLHS
jgi:Leucine-rich repeat (LRR) protein